MASPGEMNPGFEMQETGQFTEVTLRDENKPKSKRATFNVDRRVWIGVIGVVGVMCVVGVAIGATMGAAGADDILLDDKSYGKERAKYLATQDEIANDLTKLSEELHEPQPVKPDHLQKLGENEEKKLTHAEQIAAKIRESHHAENAQKVHPKNPLKVRQEIDRKVHQHKEVHHEVEHTVVEKVAEKVHHKKHHNVKNARLPTIKSGADEYCTTPQCIESGDVLLRSMNTTVDPCVDFYEFSCGGWIADHSTDDGSQGTFYDADDLLQLRLTTILQSVAAPADPQPLVDMRNFYTTCLNTDSMDAQGLSPLVSQLDKMGGWPLTEDSWNENGDDFVLESGVAAVQKLQIGPLVSVGNDANYLNTSNKILYVTEGSLGLPLAYLAHPNIYPNPVAAYTKYIADSAKLVRDAIGSAVTDESIDAETDEMVNFEMALATVMNNVVFHNFSNDLQLITVNDLQILFDNGTSNSQFNWLIYFKILFSDTDVIIDSTEPLYVILGSYMPELSNLLSKTSQRTLANYLGWFWTMVSSPETTYAMRNISQTFDLEVYGRNPSTDRSQHCVDQVNWNLGFATSRSYVDGYFSPAAKDEVAELVVQIQESFDGLIQEADWMLDEDKLVAEEKLAYIQQNTAYPDWILDDVALTAAYSGLVVQKVNHYGNLMRLADFIRYSDLSTFRDPPMTAFTGMPPTVVNAYYDVFSNSINILVGILQPPFYSHGDLYAINYGAIGLVIGHEFTHGFDNNGRRFDKYGNYNLWWTQETTENFVNRSQCFVDQYDVFSPPELIGTEYEGETVNGQQTLGENIADNGGIREAFGAYMNFTGTYGDELRLVALPEYTPEQLFFLGFANVWCENKLPSSYHNQLQSDPHSPGRFRVGGSVSNDEDFRAVWQCDAADPMDRDDESCVLW